MKKAIRGRYIELVVDGKVVKRVEETEALLRLYTELQKANDKLDKALLKKTRPRMNGLDAIVK